MSVYAPIVRHLVEGAEHFEEFWMLRLEHRGPSSTTPHAWTARFLELRGDGTGKVDVTYAEVDAPSSGWTRTWPLAKALAFADRHIRRGWEPCAGSLRSIDVVGATAAAELEETHDEPSPTAVSRF
jgi:hypothetical protein